jgi:hypothetical protein
LQLGQIFGRELDARLKWVRADPGDLDALELGGRGVGGALLGGAEEGP